MQSIAELKIQIGQLATTFSRREGGKLPSQSESNPRGQIMVESSNALEIFSEHAKSIMTLRNGKVIKHTDKTSKTNPRPLTKPEDPKVENESIAPESPYLP